MLYDDFDVISQELRLVNTDRHTWEYMFRFYYSKLDGDFERRKFKLPDSTDSDNILKTPFTNDSYAVFSRHIIHLTDAWTVQAGVDGVCKYPSTDSGNFYDLSAP